VSARPTRLARTRPEAPTTVALGLLSVSVALGVLRLLSGTRALLPVLATVLAAHALAFAARRYGLRSGPALLLATVGTVLVAVWTVLPRATLDGVPTLGTARSALSTLEVAARAFARVGPPAPPLPGFVLACCLAFGVAAIVADWAAFRAGCTLEAALPAFALWCVTAALGAPRDRGPLTAAFAVALAGFVLSRDLDRRAGIDARAAQAARAATLRRGLAIAVGCATLGATVGPFLPGAQAAPLLGVRPEGIGGPVQRTTLSPLVQIKAELLEPSSAIVFTVAASETAYWRLTALTTFNGSEWSSDESYEPAAGRLPGSGTAAATVDVQHYTIDTLDSVWLPAAYRPVSLTDSSRPVSYNAATGSLVASGPTSNGMTYTVTSVLPTYTPAQLDTARVDPNDPALAPFLQLPPLPASVRALAESVVAGQPTPYDKALALQDFFREHFTYSLAPPPSDAIPALVQFLFGTRAGYCQQFAGAYAVLARAVGLPTRVAVGFTEGENVGDGVYVVRALNAHAWPEVLLPPFGWVPFEPTPGRGNPAAVAYTGVPPEQAGPTGGTALAAPVAAGSQPSPAADRPASTAPGRRPPRPAPAGRGGFRGRVPFGLAASAAAVLVALAAATRVRSRRRRLRRSPRERVLAAWAATASRLARSGLPRAPGETLREHAQRAGGVLGEAATRYARLAALAEHAAFAPGPLPPRAVDDAEAAAAAVAAACRHRRRLTGPPGLSRAAGSARATGPAAPARSPAAHGRAPSR
jgi:transglutaminase-like putative cysteine protease